MPARAPASMDMLQTVNRPSIDSARIAGPAYSMAWPTAPAAPIFAMIARIRSFAVTPAPRAPSTVMRIASGFLCQSACVASTCATSLAPMPNASAPTAPWVEVWLSPQTISIPGCVMPCSGPTTCAMPWRASPSSKIAMPDFAAPRESASAMWRFSGSGIAAMSRLSVGT